MLDFDYMVPEIIPSALRSVHGGEHIKVNGVVYVPERTCTYKCKKSGISYIVWDFSCCGEFCENIERSGATELQFDVCPQCGAKVVE